MLGRFRRVNRWRVSELDWACDQGKAQGSVHTGDIRMLEHRDAYEDEVYVKQEVVVGWQRARMRSSYPSHIPVYIPSITSLP